MKAPRRNVIRIGKLRTGVARPCPKCGAVYGACSMTTNSGSVRVLKHDHKERPK